MEYKLSEIEEYYHEDLTTLEAKLQKAQKAIADKEAEDKKPTKTELKNLETAQAAFEKLVAEKESKIQAAHTQAEKERKAIDEVEQELLTMLQDPELRKRYFSVVDMEELEENEFNLNIPRYVDTFEPEEEIDLKEAIQEFKAVTDAETKTEISLNQYLVF